MTLFISQHLLIIVLKNSQQNSHSFIETIKKFKGKFHDATTDEEKGILVKKMIDKYFTEESVLQLNFEDDKTLKQLMIKINEKNYSEDIFDSVAEHVVEVMFEGSYSRWTRTKAFKLIKTTTPIV